MTFDLFLKCENINYFSTFNQLYKRAKPGILNAVYFGNRLHWMDFIEHVMRYYKWTHVYIDEMGEVCPANQHGKLWKKIDHFSNVAGEIRKCDMNVMYNTQSITDIDYRIRRKLMIKIFMPGAQKDGVTRVSQRAIDNLSQISSPRFGNYGYIDFRGTFGRTQFPTIYKPIRGFSVEARCNNGGEV